LNVAANLALLRGMRLAPLSLAVPLLSLTPAFATLVAIPLLGEVPSPLDLMGIGLVVGGAVWLGREAVRPGERAASTPAGRAASTAAAHRAGALWMTLTALAWSLTPALDKLALTASSPAFHALVLTAGVALAVLAVLAAAGRARELAGVARVPGVFALAVISSTLALGFQLLAFQLLWVGLVETLKRGIGNLMSLALGRAVFGERPGWAALAAVLAMAAGVALILGT
jgi:drug/metabolite transporter (DMT)-like permease